MAATGAALRLRLLFRMLRVGELLALLALLSWSSSRAPSAAAAAVRVAGSLLFSPRFVFVLGNAIVLLLLALSRREREPSPVSSATNHHSAAAAAPTPEAPAVGSFSSFADPTTPSPTRESETSVAVEAAAAPVVRPAMPMSTVFEEEVKAAAASVSAARVVLSKARAPRRSRSEKMIPRGVGSRRAASPEQQLMPLMRRSESDNGRRRRSSASARDVAGWAPGTEDAEEFQRKVEAFIAKQTRFRREEECMAGALVVVE
ncbi:hypothetical protein ACQ4PT_043289 [Festuca glaucescens]